MPSSRSSSAAASTEPSTRKQRSAEPGVGSAAFGSKSRAGLVEVQLLIAEGEGEPVAELHASHAQDAFVEREGDGEVRHREHEMVERPDPHARTSTTVVSFGVSLTSSGS